MRGRGRACSGITAALAGLAACGELGEYRRFEAEVGALRIVETIPAPGSTADPLTRVDICLSAEVDPRALDDFDATLHSAELVFDTTQEVQLLAWRAPGSRDELATERWCPGSVLSLTPAGPLQPGLTYRVQLRPALLGWAGESLDTTQDGWAENLDGELRWFFEFRIAGSPADPQPEDVPTLPPGPTLTDLFEPGEIFDPERAACGCHQTPGELGWARLDLGDPQTAWSELVLRTGLEPTDFPMVTPRRPAESYLLHKLTRTSEGGALHGVRGVPMPPDGGGVEHGDLVRVAHWIAEGGEL